MSGSHAHDHGHDPAEDDHDDDDHHDAAPPPDEPVSPTWLPLLGGALFLMALLAFLVTRTPDAEEAAPAGADAAAAPADGDAAAADADPHEGHGH